jgi:hypothetical protein
MFLSTLRGKHPVDDAIFSSTADHGWRRAAIDWGSDSTMAYTGIGTPSNIY